MDRTTYFVCTQVVQYWQHEHSVKDANLQSLSELLSSNDKHVSSKFRLSHSQHYIRINSEVRVVACPFKGCHHLRYSSIIVGE